MSTSSLRLGEIKVGQQVRILALDGQTEISSRLMEMGLLEGSLVELLHEAPFGGDPIAVRVRGALIALRRSEANLILVSEVIE